MSRSAAIPARRQSATAFTRNGSACRKTALVFPHVHSYADDEHCAVGARNLAERAATEEQKNRIRTAIRMTYDVWRYQGTMTRHKLSECWRGDGSAKFYI